jgi:pimeloyl-ACP methyl ester carboxylesterase
MGYALNFRRIAREFEATHRVLAYDQRGHGRSFHADLAAEPDAYSPERMADDLRLILDDLGWSRIRLVGHSMGGRVALTFAALYPERVESLVIVDIGPEMIEVAGGASSPGRRRCWRLGSIPTSPSLPMAKRPGDLMPPDSRRP